MSDQTPLPDQKDQPAGNQLTIPPSTDQDWRDTRRSEREARREEQRARRGSSGGAWIGGAILILLGVIFLLQTVSGIHVNNWWALFILLPAIGSFAAAWNSYQQNGRLTKSARGALIGGFVLLLITATFLFNWNWGLVFPILIIVLGISLLLNSLLPD